MTMRVKICGLGRADEVELCEGADMIGVVIEAPRSPRSRDWLTARSIFSAAEGRFLRVAVLVRPDADTVRRSFDEGADQAQIHGGIPSGLEEDELLRLIPSVPMPRAGGGRLPPGFAKAWEGPFPLVHLDTRSEQGEGGTGTSWDWSLGPPNRPLRARPFLVAGGLTAENVGEAIRLLHPWGVDVSTGVEARPGVKDGGLIRSFLTAVRAAEDLDA
jgi:phosphoribosylanthranilate isomerase